VIAGTVTRWARPLPAVRRGDADTVGAKAADLGEMLAADLPVPAGFVLTVAAYLDSMDAAGVRAELARLHALALAAAGRSGGEPELADLCTEMRDVVRKAGPSPEVVEEIHAAYRDLGIEDFGPVTVAVRSSALGEDGAAASFAGMHSSFTNVRGADALLAQVLECWASTVAPRAIVYRAERGITTEPAVAVEPDTYTFSSPDLHLVSVRVGNQTHEIVQGRDGHDLTVTLDHERATSRVLDDQAAEAVARMALRVEAHFGAPQDVEWAMIARQVWLVQARPITTLTGQEDVDRKDAERRRARRAEPRWSPVSRPHPVVPSGGSGYSMDRRRAPRFAPGRSSSPR
jgi:pyruvate,water dikinase